MTIIETREKRAKLWNTMEGFLDTHRNDKGVLSAEDDATYSAMEQDLNDLTTEIRRMERRDAIEAELNKPVGRPLTGMPEKPHADEKKGRASNAYKEDFGRHLRGKAPIRNVLSESVDADGGYLVPEEFENQIITGPDEANVIRSLAKVITTHHDRKIPIAVGHSVATWTAENAAFTESNPTFWQKQIDAFKLTDLIRVSVELLQDAEFDLETYIANEFARAFGIAEEQAFCVGTGSNQPTGIFTEEGGAYLWQPSVQAGQPDKLLGYDLYTSPYVPTVEAGAFAIAFGDFQNYWIGDRAGRTVQRLNELYATNGQIGYVAAERVDGKVILPEGIQLLQMRAASGS